MHPIKPLVLAIVLLPLARSADAQRDDTWAANDKTTFAPQVHHANIAGVKLFAQNPDIVTPVGIAVAPDGGVFVQENHTHKRESHY